MRMPAFFAASFGIALAQAEAPDAPHPPPMRITETPAPLHIEALRAMQEGTIDEFAGSWPSRAPRAFEFNGAAFYLLPCANEEAAVAPASSAAPHVAPGRRELDRLLRVYPWSGPACPNSPPER